MIQLLITIHAELDRLSDTMRGMIINNMDNPLVSISCITYNHEKYIADAIESFLMQKTEFCFEILIHDDASTDQTPDIIRKYEKKYPNIIKPIYQIKNQHSQGIQVALQNGKRARGKYTAFCEGDDYWTDSCKLQKQISYMESHPDCSMCFHAVEVVDNDKKVTGEYINPYRNNCIVSIEDIIVGGGGFFGTNSIVYRTKYLLNPPEFYLKCPIEDAPIVLTLATKGYIYYISEGMSAYRTGINGSWTNTTWSSKSKTIEHLMKMHEMRKMFNQYTNFAYSSSVDRMQIKTEIAIYSLRGDLKALHAERYKDYIKKMGKLYLLKLYLKKYIPFLSYLVRKKK